MEGIEARCRRRGPPATTPKVQPRHLKSSAGICETLIDTRSQQLIPVVPLGLLHTPQRLVTSGDNNLSCVRHLHDRMGVTCLDELGRWRVTFRRRESHHTTGNDGSASLQATDRVARIFRVELTAASYQPTSTNRAAFYPLRCQSLQRTCDIRPRRIFTSSRQFTSQGCRKQSLIVCPGARPWWGMQTQPKHFEPNLDSVRE